MIETFKTYLIGILFCGVIAAFFYGKAQVQAPASLDQKSASSSQSKESEKKDDKSEKMAASGFSYSISTCAADGSGEKIEMKADKIDMEKEEIISKLKQNLSDVQSASLNLKNNRPEWGLLLGVNKYADYAHISYSIGALKRINDSFYAIGTIDFAHDTSVQFQKIGAGVVFFF